MTSENDQQIDAIQRQQAKLQLASFDSSDVWQLGTILVTLIRERSLRAAVRITRGEQVVFHWAADGASLDNDGWLERKIRTVNRFGDSSLLVGLLHQRLGRDFAAQPWIDAGAFSANGGAFPIIVRRVGPVAVLAVSGLTDEADHALAVEALETYLARQSEDGRVTGA